MFGSFSYTKEFIVKRKAGVMTLVSFLMAFGINAAQAAEYAILAEVSPANVLFSGDIDKFSVTNDATGLIEDQVKSQTSYVPTLGGGFEIDTQLWRYHVLAGLGMLEHDAFSANILKLEVAAYYTGGLQTGFMVGPHVSAYHFYEPSWDESVSVHLDSTSAVAPGIAFTVGDKFIIKGSVDYLLGADINVQPANGYSASSESLSLDGIMVSLGVMMRF